MEDSRISLLSLYCFYEPILYLDCDASFLSSEEKPGWWWVFFDIQNLD
jgi:hypothetical protein